jgi:hypothetical protein
MTDLQDATERICRLKGEAIALDAVLTALAQIAPPEMRAAWAASFGHCAEVAGTVLLNADVSEHAIDGFDANVRRLRALLGAHEAPRADCPAPAAAPRARA